jgi:GNAT superfamily N-acetyltransferase
MQTAISAGLHGLGLLWSKGASTRLAVHDFTFLGGPPTEALLDLHLPATLVCDEAWSALVDRVFGPVDRLPRTAMGAPRRWPGAAASRPDIRAAEHADLPDLAHLSAPLAATPPDAACAMVALREGAIVAACGAYARHGHDIEAEVAVAEDHWGRGLGTAVAWAWRDRVLARGLRPHWDAANQASERIALGLGFSVDRRWEALWLPSR